MKLLPFSLTLSVVVILAACSDSSSTNSSVGEDTTDGEGVEQVEMGVTGGTPVDSESETGATTDETDAAGTETTGTGETTAGEPTPTFADYRITFDANWSAVTHPTQFPSNPHFSGLVGAVHSDQVTFWEPGQIASDGIELMAETGGKSIFLNEIDSAISSGYALSAIDGPGITVSPGSASIEVRVTVDFPKVTLTTMLAPSPDWFAGFHNIRFFEDGAFIDILSIDGIVYDSGTDNGVSFTSGDNDTQPRDTIVRTTSEPTDSPFLQGLPSVGRFVIERL